MAYIDPWGNFTQGMQNLQNVLANMDSSAQQKKLRDLQIEEAQIKLAAAKQGAEDKQALRDLEQTLASERKDVTTPGYGGLADVQAYEQASQANRDKAALPVMWSDTATAPIPAGGRGINIPTMSGQTAPPAAPPVMGRGLGAATPSVYEQFSKNVAERPYTQDQLDALNEKAIAAQQASGLSSYAPTTAQVPLTSLEKAQRRADLLAGQGAYKEAGEALTAGIDISSKIPAAAVDQQHKLLAFAQPRLALGASPEQVKEQTIAFAKQMGMSADQIAALQNMTLSPNGMMIATLPDGSKVTATLQADGTVKTEYHKKEADSSMTGGLDVLAAKNRAMALMKRDPRLTQAEAMAQAADQIRAENNQAKQANIQLRIDAAGGAGGMGKAQKTDFIDADGTPLNFYSQTGQYLRPDGSAPSQVVKRPPAAVAESAGATTQLINEIRDVKNIAKSVTTGPVAGRVGSTAQTFGAASDQFTDLNSKLQNVHNVMLKLRSGQAVTETEYRRFVREFPTVNDPPAVFQRKADNAINNLQSSLAARGQSLQTTGFAAPGTQQRPLTPKAGTARPLSKY